MSVESEMHICPVWMHVRGTFVHVLWAGSGFLAGDHNCQRLKFMFTVLKCRVLFSVFLLERVGGGGADGFFFGNLQCMVQVGMRISHRSFVLRLMEIRNS